MYSTTIKSDGMLHRPAAPPPAPKKTAPPARAHRPAPLTGDTLLILAIALLLLQNKKPDWPLLIALAYLLL